MTDIQILTLALTLLGIFAGSWFNNSRIGDLNSRLGDVKEGLRAEMKGMEAGIALQFERTNQKIDTILRLLADIDERVTNLESRK